MRNGCLRGNSEKDKGPGELGADHLDGFRYKEGLYTRNGEPGSYS